MSDDVLNFNFNDLDLENQEEIIIPGEGKEEKSEKTEKIEETTASEEDEGKEENKEDVIEIPFSEETQPANSDNNNETTEEGGNEEQDSSIKFLSLQASILKEQGVVDYEDDFKIESIDDYNKLISNTIDKGIETYKQSFQNDKVKDFIEAVEAGVDLEKYKQIIVEEIEYEKISDDDLKSVEDGGNEAIQEKMVMDMFTLRNFSKEDAKEQVELLKSSGKLSDYAIKSRNFNVQYKKEQKKIERQVAEQNKQNRQQAVQQNTERALEILDNTKEIVKGVKMTDALKKKAKSLMLNPVVGNDGNKQSQLTALISKDKVAFETRLIMLVAAGFFDNKADTSVISRTAESTATKKVEEFIRGIDNKHTGEGPANTSKNAPSTEDILKSI
jgi:hypothetical protein